MDILTKPVLEKPVVGGSTGKWGFTLNKNIDAQDEFNNKVATKLNSQNTKVQDLETNKLNKTELSTTIAPKVDEYINLTAKGEIDNYVTSTNKPALDLYVDEKKKNIDAFIKQAGILNIKNSKNFQMWLGTVSEFDLILEKQKDVLYMAFNEAFELTKTYFQENIQ